VVVSASLDVYLSDWCKKLGVDLICTELGAGWHFDRRYSRPMIWPLAGRKRLGYAELSWKRHISECSRAAQ
jgi:hypothetical protein